MATSKKKAAKPKNVYLESNPPDELPKFTLSCNENKLFDEEDDVGVSTIHDLSIAKEECEEEEVTPTKVWDHAIDTLFKLSTAYVDGKSLRKWVQHEGMDTMEQFYEWDERYLAKQGELFTSYLDTPWEKGV